MRRFCSWGRRAAHSHPLLALLIGSACALGVSLNGCSRGTSGRSLLSRLTRSDSAETTVGTSHLLDEEEVAPVGGLSEGARRIAADAAPSAGQTATETENEPMRTSPPTNDPWVNQPAPSIPDDGRPVASLDQTSTGNTRPSRGVDEWLAEIEGSRRTHYVDSVGSARLDDVQPQATAEGNNPFAGTASLASSQQTRSQQSIERPVWASESTPASHAELPRTTSTTTTPPTQPAATSDSNPSQATAESSRRIEALLQVDALLSRAHDLEAQGKPHEAYRFALVAHQIVQQERLVLPPGQERPIDYLDALSAATDTVEADTSRDHQRDRSFDAQSVEQTQSPIASSDARESHSDAWSESFASDTSAGDSPFHQAAGFAEWRSLPADHGDSLTRQTNSPVHSATFGGGAVPVIRPSHQATSRGDVETQDVETVPVSAPANESIEPPAYGPRFSDPVTSGVGQDFTVQRVSLSVDLNEPIETADLNGFDRRNPYPSSWQGTDSKDGQIAAALPEGDIVPQIGLASGPQLQQPSSSVQGPGFGNSIGDANSSVGDDSAIDDEFDELALSAESQPSRGIAGKPLAFWAMIGGLVLLLGCALLRRPAESRDSFH